MRRGGVTPYATVQVEARTHAIGQLFDFFEGCLPREEQSVLVGGQTWYRITGSGTRANAGIGRRCMGGGYGQSRTQEG